MTDCLFCKIGADQIPADKVHDDEDLFVIKDLNPAAPVHYLIIPHEHVETIAEFGPSHRRIVGRVYEVAGDIARRDGFGEAGYRVVANCNRDGGQTVFHVHFHLMAGRAFSWPPG